MGFRVRFRFALAWLLMVALPIQGMAAATLLNCGPAHHQMEMAQAADASSMEAHHHAHDLHAPSTGHEAHHLDLAKFSKAKCSACAACCIGAGLPPSAIVLESMASTSTQMSFVAAPQAVFFTDGPDRPPRSLRA